MEKRKKKIEINRCVVFDTEPTTHWRKQKMPRTRSSCARDNSIFIQTEKLRVAHFVSLFASHSLVFSCVYEMTLEHRHFTCLVLLSTVAHFFGVYIFQFGCRKKKNWNKKRRKIKTKTSDTIELVIRRIEICVKLCGALCTRHCLLYWCVHARHFSVCLWSFIVVAVVAFLVHFITRRIEQMQQQFQPKRTMNRSRTELVFVLEKWIYMPKYYIERVRGI